MRSKEEAKALAVSLLRERAYEFLQATGQAIGLPDMRPGDNVVIKGIGKRFSGQYYVTKVEHTIGNNGYLTGFDVRRSATAAPRSRRRQVSRAGRSSPARRPPTSASTAWSRRSWWT